jgi:hypothetical protein
MTRRTILATAVLLVCVTAAAFAQRRGGFRGGFGGGGPRGPFIQ